MAGLFVGAALLLLLAWRLVRRYIRNQWNGPSDTSAWHVGVAVASALAGSALLWCCGSNWTTSPLVWESGSESWSFSS